MTLARELIDADADKVVRRLARRGHKAYLVGGCVRDLLLERTPKDFDVATSATPNEIKQLFRNCRIIGRRFRLAHIFFGGKIIETSTFRANPRGDGQDADAELLIRRDNVFGSEEEDARRRDFTINGLFYDVRTGEVIDHVDGLKDLEARVVRTIGDPTIRFREDPVRMLRAIKFAARLDLDIEKDTYAALLRHRIELTKCAPPRVLEELYRMLRGRAARPSMRLLIDTGVAAVMSPRLASLFEGEADEAKIPAEPPAKQTTGKPTDPEEQAWEATWRDDHEPTAERVTMPPSIADTATCRAMAWRMLDELDALAARGGELSNAMILGAVTSPYLVDDLLRPDLRPIEAGELIAEVLDPLVREPSVARRDAERAKQVLLAQRRLAPSRRRRGRPMALVRRDYFEEALSVYELTATVAGRDTQDIKRWRQLASEGAGDAQLARDEDGQPRKRRRRRRGGRRRRRTEPESTAPPEQGAVVSG